jgi:hypothetical protein
MANMMDTTHSKNGKERGAEKSTPAETNMWMFRKELRGWVRRGGGAGRAKRA